MQCGGKTQVRGSTLHQGGADHLFRAALGRQEHSAHDPADRVFVGQGVSDVQMKALQPATIGDPADPLQEAGRLSARFDRPALAPSLDRSCLPEGTPRSLSRSQDPKAALA